MTGAPDETVAWYHHPLAIALLAVFVLGPLALPLVWRSPALGTTARWAATALILAYTAYTAVVAWRLWVAMQPLVQQLLAP
jgi:hypothetical protein